MSLKTDTTYIEPIIRAIKEKRVIGIVHERFGKASERMQNAKCKVQNAKSETRIIHPYLLKEYNNRWYVIGWDENEKDIRTFGLDRIRSIERVENPYRKSDFDPREYFKYTIGIIAPQSKPPQIKIEFTKQQAQYLLTQPIHHSQRVLKETKEKVVFWFELHPTYEFISFILGSRDNAKVISPVWLKDRMKQILNRMVENYG